MVHFIQTILITLLHIIRFILRPIFVLIYHKKPESLPQITNPLLKLSATVLAKKIRNRELSSQTVVDAYIERIKEVNPFVNAVVEGRYDAALNDAKICDNRIKNGEVAVSSLEAEKPLYGVPVTIKESCSLKGMSYTGGTLSRQGIKAAENGAAVQLLLNAGAIPLLVSNTSELCTALHTFNYLFGATVNPYGTRKTSGGSSGGEASLIGAGASVLGIGSDLIGSIRIPAFYTGIFGHKPTPGIVPVAGHFPLSENKTFQKILTLGPLARRAEDLHLAMKVLSSRCEKALRLDDPVDLKNLRVFYWDNAESFCGVRATTSEIRRKVHKVTSYFSKKGAPVEQLSQDWISDIHYMLMATFGHMDMPNLLDSDDPKNKRNAYLELIKSTVGLSQQTSSVAFTQLIIDTEGFFSPEAITHYENRREDVQRRINDLLKDNGILVCPTFHHAADFPQLSFFEYDATIYCAFANLMYLPSTHIPLGLNEDGIPIGIQVISASYQDHICLAVAKELEKEFGGWVPPS